MSFIDLGVLEGSENSNTLSVLAPWSFVDIDGSTIDLSEQHIPKSESSQNEIKQILLRFNSSHFDSDLHSLFVQDQ